MKAIPLRNLLCLALLFALAACSSMFERGTRSINIVHPPSGERVAGVYWQDGSYVKPVMRKINRLFRDRAANREEEIDPKLIDQIHKLLSALALPEDTEVQLTSGFRDPARNHKLADKNNGVARESLHTKGQAADIRIKGIDGKAVAAVAKTMQHGGVSYYPKSRHIHVDTGDVRSWNPRH